MATGRAMRWMHGSAIAAILLAAVVATALVVGAAARSRPGVDRVPGAAQPVTVQRVLTGDVVVVAVPGAGTVWSAPGPVTARLAGVAVGDPGPTCVASARDHLGALLPVGSTVWAVAGGAPDDAGIWPVYLWTTSAGLVNDVLALNGDVAALPAEDGDRYTTRLAQSVEAASRRGVGRWGDCG